MEPGLTGNNSKRPHRIVNLSTCTNLILDAPLLQLASAEFDTPKVFLDAETNALFEV